MNKLTKNHVLVTRSAGCSGATPVGKNSKWSNNPSDDESPPASPTRDGGARTRNKLRGTPVASVSSSGIITNSNLFCFFISTDEVINFPIIAPLIVDDFFR